MKYFAQYKACERELLIMSEQNNDACADACNNEVSDSSVEGENDNRFALV